VRLGIAVGMLTAQELPFGQAFRRKTLCVLPGKTP